MTSGAATDLHREMGPPDKAAYGQTVQVAFFPLVWVSEDLKGVQCPKCL